jgi:Zn-dependent peptidase ImmA (M78 family)
VNRLKAYRDLEGITQSELGLILGLSPQMVSAIESGRRTYAGNLKAIGYRDDRFNLPAMSEPLHRLRISTTMMSRDRAKEILRLGGEVFGELAARTKRSPRLRLEKYDPPRSVNDVEEIATDVRGVLEHERTGPVHNLTAAVERAGVCLVPIVGLEGIDGLSSWVNGVAVIGLSTAVQGDRFRLTLAHELGHLFFHTRGGETTESEANQFACALLFPRSDFDAAMPLRPQLRDFIGLKASWGVSVAALIYRAHELEFIDDARFRALQIQMSKWRKYEPGSFEPVYGTLLPRLVEVNGGISHVATELGLRRSHLADTVNWRRVRVA